MNEIFPDLPPILELERNLSLTFINSHFSLEQSVPLLPNQVEVGGIYCRPGRPLPKVRVKYSLIKVITLKI